MNLIFECTLGDEIIKKFLSCFHLKMTSAPHIKRDVFDCSSRTKTGKIKAKFIRGSVICKQQKNLFHHFSIENWMGTKAREIWFIVDCFLQFQKKKLIHADNYTHYSMFIVLKQNKKISIKWEFMKSSMRMWFEMDFKLFYLLLFCFMHTCVTTKPFNSHSINPDDGIPNAFIINVDTVV